MASPRRYVRDGADLPQHDFVDELPGSLGRLPFHVRHYEHLGRHVVIVGEVVDGASPIVCAAPIAQHVADGVVPPGCDFTFPYGFHTRELAAAMNGQPAKRQDAGAEALAGYEPFGIGLAEVRDRLPFEVGEVVVAVDRACAAYECLHPAAGSSSAGAS